MPCRRRVSPSARREGVRVRVPSPALLFQRRSGVLRGRRAPELPFARTSEQSSIVASRPLILSPALEGADSGIGRERCNLLSRGERLHTFSRHARFLGLRFTRRWPKAPPRGALGEYTVSPRLGLRSPASLSAATCTFTQQPFLNHAPATAKPTPTTTQPSFVSNPRTTRFRLNHPTSMISQLQPILINNSTSTTPRPRHNRPYPVLIKPFISPSYLNHQTKRRGGAKGRVRPRRADSGV